MKAGCVQDENTNFYINFLDILRLDCGKKAVVRGDYKKEFLENYSIVLTHIDEKKDFI